MPELQNSQELEPTDRSSLYTCPMHPEKRQVNVLLARLPRAHATELPGAADNDKNLPLAMLRRAQFPATLPDGAGGTLTKPTDW